LTGGKRFPGPAERTSKTRRVLQGCFDLKLQSFTKILSPEIDFENPSGLFGLKLNVSFENFYAIIPLIESFDTRIPEYANCPAT
jgi:hypothetical protein